MPNEKSDARRDQRSHEDIGREIDSAEPSEATKKAVAKDLDAHLPADMIDGQSAQEPQKISQRKEEEDRPPGAL